MREWSRLGSLQTHAITVLRARCCAGSESLPVPPSSCGGGREVHESLASAARGKTPIDTALDRLDLHRRCEAGQDPSGGEVSPEEARAFRAFFQRVRP
jgi:hypothetical protein